MSVDSALMQLTHDVQRELAALAVKVAHAKLLLRGNRGTAVAKLVSNEAAPRLSQESREGATSLDLMVNLRAQGEPDLVQLAIQTSFNGWSERHQLEIVTASGQAFKPSRPVPTHRVPGAT